MYQIDVQFMLSSKQETEVFQWFFSEKMSTVSGGDGGGGAIGGVRSLPIDQTADTMESLLFKVVCYYKYDT